MSKRITKNQKRTSIKYSSYTCGECAYGKWNTDFNNSDPRGFPITVRCPFYEDGEVGIVRTQKACQKFKLKEYEDPYSHYDR